MMGTEMNFNGIWSSVPSSHWLFFFLFFFFSECWAALWKASHGLIENKQTLVHVNSCAGGFGLNKLVAEQGDPAAWANPCQGTHHHAKGSPWDIVIWYFYVLCKATWGAPRPWAPFCDVGGSDQAEGLVHQVMYWSPCVNPSSSAQIWLRG